MYHKHQPLGKLLPTSVTGVECLSSVCVCFLASLMPSNTQWGFPLVCNLIWARWWQLFDTDFPQTSHTRCFFTSSISEFPCANILPHVYYIWIYSQVWNLCHKNVYISTRVAAHMLIYWISMTMVKEWTNYSQVMQSRWVCWALIIRETEHNSTFLPFMDLQRKLPYGGLLNQVH
jgi:hypothetical protein